MDEDHVQTGGQAPAAPSGVSEVSLKHLRGTRRWVKLFSIVLFIGAGVMAVGGVALGVWMTFSSNRGGLLPGPLSGTAPGMLFGGLYLVGGLLYLFPALYLSRYAAAIGRLQATRSLPDLEDALHHQKSFWRYVGVMILVGLILAVVGLLASVALPLVLMLLGRGGPIPSA